MNARTPPPTHYVYVDGSETFVKPARLFADQGGHTEAWGHLWVPIHARSVDHARKIAAVEFARAYADLCDSEAP